MNRAEFKGYWVARAQELGRLRAQVDGNLICQEFLVHLELLWSHDDAAEVSLLEAATLTGYSADHLRRLARQGKLEAHRRGGRLYLRVTDLPKKAATIARHPVSGYDPKADARRVAARRNGENTHGTQAVA